MDVALGRVGDEVVSDMSDVAFGAWSYGVQASSLYGSVPGLLLPGQLWLLLSDNGGRQAITVGLCACFWRAFVIFAVPSVEWGCVRLGPVMSLFEWAWPCLYLFPSGFPQLTRQ